ncbi:MAG: sugar ABC transporter permease [Caldilineaceae bacterium]|nr:sugar ABC transporter permease [Caldilineaceae bacterium]MBP8123692.1 sugar ABC transporter permease [Caldilineaceae bacterium]MBP9073832.1 sugar ABC transporter permease [Caldilineaceae bacterium]
MASISPAQAAPDSQITTKKRRFYRPQSWFPILLIAPSLIVIALVIVYPVLYSLYVSFTPFHLLRPETTFVFTTETMFRNYTKLAGDRVFWKSVMNTVIFLTVTVNLSFVISLALSQLMARVTRGQSIMRTLLMVPMMFAPVLVGFQFAWFFNATVGLVNNAATALGWMTEPKAWLVDQPSGMISIMVATIWMNIPMMTIILLAGTLSLPRDVYEAADVDGAPAWQKFRHITFPLLRPFTLIALTVLSLDVARAYDVVRIMTGGGPAHRTEMIWTNAGRLAIRNSQFGLASAMSMIGVVLGVLFTLYLFSQLIKSRIVY